ncbi:MAG: exodeoxyribonuclease III [Anaerolineae bacterium]|nr:exodeoxyribonuclease III [Anaerolineae bacterium]
MTPNALTLLSWNVNGIRAAYHKGFLEWFHTANPDILCLQETRAEETQLPDRLAHPAGYYTYWNASKAKKGYSGTALLSKVAPLNVEFGLGIERFDQEGRTITAHYPDFTLLNCYFPNGRRDHSRVQFKMEFYAAFLEKCQRLREAGETVLFCGDVNTAHRPIDLARPRENRNTTGFLPEERAWIDRFLETGYVDTFRHLYPQLEGQYTWWSQVTRARERNVGWRLDYVFIAEEALDHITGAFILADIPGSDHCPVGVQLQPRSGQTGAAE